MSIFNKISQGARSLFNKATNPVLFRKINNTARKIDNSVQKVGIFLLPIVSGYNPAYGAQLANGLASTHNIRMGIQNGLDTATRVKNSLEKAIKPPQDNITSHYG